jgi:hypothetical protein
MEHLSLGIEQQNQQVQWRRDKVQELCSKGYSQRDIANLIGRRLTEEILDFI